MAIGLRRTKTQISLYPTRDEKKRWASVAKALQQQRDLDKFSLTDIIREAMAEYESRHKDELPAQASHITMRHS
jgi:hypothetical protein